MSSRKVRYHTKKRGFIVNNTLRKKFEAWYLKYVFLDADPDDLVLTLASEAGVELKYEDFEVHVLWEGFKAGYEAGREDGFESGQASVMIAQEAGNE